MFLSALRPRLGQKVAVSDGFLGPFVSAILSRRDLSFWRKHLRLERPPVPEVDKGKQGPSGVSIPSHSTAVLLLMTGV